MKVFWITLLCFCSIYSFSQEPYSPPDLEKRKCYSKCVVDSMLVEEIEVVYPIYTGDKYNQIAKIEYRQLVTLNEDNEKVKVFVPVLLDESTTLLFEYRTFLEEKYTKTGGSDYVWKEILCLGDRHFQAMEEITPILIEGGYLTKKPKRKRMRFEIHHALIAFQKDNFLPQGGLNLETLDFLNIEY